jgi:hypothetical protein
MNDKDYWTLKAMKSYGGGFVKALALAADHADANNLERLKQAFPEYWKNYSDMGEHLKKNK